MQILRKAYLSVLIVLAGCAQIEVRNSDVAPGGTVTTENYTTNFFAGWIPQVSSSNRPGIDHWTRIRVIAPEGAAECRSGSMFSQGGPQSKGKPDTDRVVMLTSRQGDRIAHFVCDTPNGPVKRSVDAAVFVQKPSEGNKLPSFWKPHEYHVLPPLVHIDPRDPAADARWTAIAAELCPVISERTSSFVCKPGMLEKFKASDLGKAP